MQKEVNRLCWLQDGKTEDFATEEAACNAVVNRYPEAKIQCFTMQGDPTKAVWTLPVERPERLKRPPTHPDDCLCARCIDPDEPMVALLETRHDLT